MRIELNSSLVSRCRLLINKVERKWEKNTIDLLLSFASVRNVSDRIAILAILKIDRTREENEEINNRKQILWLSNKHHTERSNNRSFALVRSDDYLIGNRAFLPSEHVFPRRKYAFFFFNETIESIETGRKFCKKPPFFCRWISQMNWEEK